MDKQQSKIETLEALQSIKQTEQDARRIILDARERATSEISRRAHEEAKRIREDLLNEATRRALEKKNSLISKAEKEAESIRREASEEALAIRRKADAVIPGVVDELAVKIKKCF